MGGSLSAGPKRVGIALITLAISGCKARLEPSPKDAAVAAPPTVTAPTLPRSPFAELGRSAAAEALKHARALEPSLGAGCSQNAAYLSLRRAVARGKPYWRGPAVEPAEVLLGPQSPVLEGGGHLGLLDAALAEGDCRAAMRARYQVEQALRLIELQLERPVPTRVSVQALCNVAVDLGQVLLESHAEVGVTEAGVLADAEGALDAIERGLGALNAPPVRPGTPANDVARSIASLRAALERARSEGLRGRGLLVLETGTLGVALRLVARERGHEIRPPYLARSSSSDPVAEPANVLTVPAPRSAVDPRAAALGKRLFSDRRLSNGEDRSCATCHRPELAFTDGRARAPSLVEGVTLRNTPTLLYASAQAAQLWDGRVLTSNSQALRVMHSAAEMGVSAEELEKRLRGDAALAAEFARVFPDGLTAATVARALSEFQRAELVPAGAPIDRFARGERSALGAIELAGLDVFAGTGRCARCHVPPLFGGTRPNDFAVTVYAVIGATRDPSGKELDPDRGRSLATRNAADDFAFKTPTVRNVARTAPYFHNGAFPTLETVVDFYDRGGARGFGVELGNQDPDVRPLKLTAKEKTALLTFMRRSLTDAR